MSEHSSKPSAAEDEIDLRVIFKGVKWIFNSLLKFIIRIISFFYKQKYILLSLVVFGVGLGYVYDVNVKKTYESEMLLLPNYNSVDLLYTKVDAIDKKIKAKDTIFLKNIFGNDFKKLKAIEIEPVMDIYNFVSRSETNKELFELLYEEEADLEFLENPINSKNFKFHNLNLSIKGEDNHEKFSKAIIDYVNSNEYYDYIKDISIESLKLRIEKNEEIIKQIDTVIKNIGQRNLFGMESDGISFNNNPGINELLNKKMYLVERQLYLNVEMENQSDVVKVITSNYKVLDTEEFLKKDKKKLFPIFFIFAYLIIYLFVKVYKKAQNPNS